MLVACSYIVLPAIIATLYAVVWPTVSSRVGLFITLGSVSGMVVGIASLFCVAQPLIGVGSSAARPGQTSDSLGSLLGSRAMAGAIVEVAAVCLLLVALSRWLQARWIGLRFADCEGLRPVRWW